MKTIYKKIIAIKDIYSKDYAKRISLLMLLFFVLFGIVSFYVLVNTGG